MILKVHHVTTYRYDRPVRGVVQSHRLTPSRCDGQRVLDWSIKVSDGIAGGAFRESYPDFGERLRFAAGLGLRYYTGIGPIRLDVAFPLQKEAGQRGYGVYLGIGQAF